MNAKLQNSKLQSKTHQTCKYKQFQEISNGIFDFDNLFNLELDIHFIFVFTTFYFISSSISKIIQELRRKLLDVSIIQNSIH